MEIKNLQNRKFCWQMKRQKASSTTATAWPIKMTSTWPKRNWPRWILVSQFHWQRKKRLRRQQTLGKFQNLHIPSLKWQIYHQLNCNLHNPKEVSFWWVISICHLFNWVKNFTVEDNKVSDVKPILKVKKEMDDFSECPSVCGSQCTCSVITAGR